MIEKKILSRIEVKISSAALERISLGRPPENAAPALLAKWALEASNRFELLAVKIADSAAGTLVAGGVKRRDTPTWPGASVGWPST